MLRIVAIGLSLVALAQSPSGGTFASVYLTARNSKGLLIHDVRPEDLRVFEGRKELTIRSVSRATGPMDVGILLDASTGVIPTLETEAEAATYFFSEVMRPGDLGFTIGYNNHVDVLQAPAEDTRLIERNTARVAGYGRYVIAPQPKLIPLQPVPAPIPLPFPRPLPGKPPVGRPSPPEPIPSNRSRGNGAIRQARLYDAVILATNRFLIRENGRNALVVVALSDEAGSTASLDDALRAAKRSGVVIYIVEVELDRPGIGAVISGVFRRTNVIRRDNYDLPNEFTNVPEARIGRLAEETGGRVIRVKGFDKTRKALAEIADDLRWQQRMVFTPTTEDDGLLRPLEIQTRVKGGKVYAANAYYPAIQTKP